MAIQLGEHGGAVLLHSVGVICAGKDGLGWDGTGAGMSSPIDCTALAHFILDGQASLLRWLVWILLPSKHIITSTAVPTVSKTRDGVNQIARQNSHPAQHVQGVGSHHSHPVPHLMYLYACMSEILCMCSSHCVSAHSPCAQDSNHVKKRKWKKTVDLFSLNGSLAFFLI